MRTDDLHGNWPPTWKILVTVLRELTTRYGRGFSYPELTRMVQFAQPFLEHEIVPTLSQQLSWSHVHALLPIKDPLARGCYAEICRSERWDVRSSDVNRATIEPSEVSVMTLNGLSMPGIGVSNEPR